MSDMSEIFSENSMPAVMPDMPMPCLCRQVADIPAYVSYHGLDDYILFTKPRQTYEFTDPEKAEQLHLEHLEQLEKPFDAYNPYSRSLDRPLDGHVNGVPIMERQMGQPENYVFEFGVEAYKKHKNDPRSIEEILKNKDMKDANDQFMSK